MFINRNFFFQHILISIFNVYLKGYVAKNSLLQQPGQIQNQQSLNCQPGVMIPSNPHVQPQPQLVREVSMGQFVPQSANCQSGGVQTILS